MRWIAVAVLAACAAGAPARKPAYPLHPQLRSASGGPVEMIGAIAHPGAIPYATGMTLTCALRLAGGPTGFATSIASLQRGHFHYQIPLRRIIDGSAPDPELAPGDTIRVLGLSD